jgi:hypothetical protein
MVRKVSLLPGFDPLTVQPVANSTIYFDLYYRDADKSLALPTSRYILMVRIFRLMLVVLYIYKYY